MLETLFASFLDELKRLYTKDNSYTNSYTFLTKKGAPYKGRAKAKNSFKA